MIKGTSKSTASDRFGAHEIIQLNKLIILDRIPRSLSEEKVKMKAFSARACMAENEREREKKKEGGSEGMTAYLQIFYFVP